MRKLLRWIIGLAILPLIYFTYNFFSWATLPEKRLEARTIGIANETYRNEIDQASSELFNILTRLNVPSASVAVGVDGQIVWSEAIGYADVQKQIPATPQTAYRIGSTSKAMTSTALMLLEQQGKLDLDQAVIEILPDFPEKEWNFTTRQLLSHTAGIIDYEQLGLYGGFYSLLNFRQFDSVEEGLKIFKNRPLQFEPGTNFMYNSFDIVLASRVLEVVADQPYLDFLKEHLFTPLGMTNSYGDHGPYGGENEAIFYQIDQDQYRKWHTFNISPHKVNLSYKWAGGGLLSTPTDLVKMGNALVNDPSFVNFYTRDEFFTPQLLNMGIVNPQEYALGWRSNRYFSSAELFGEKAVWMVHHGGVSKGSMNFLCLFPDQKVVLDVAINGRAEDIDFSPFWEAAMKMVGPFLN